MKRSIKRATPGLLAALLLKFSVAQAQPALFHHLKTGPYETGYRTEWQFDYQRTWGCSPRPIRLNIWYPAQKSSQNKMLFERYVFTEPPNTSFIAYRDLLRQRDVGDSTKSLKGLFSGSQKLYDALLKIQTNAIENAAPLKGKFPVIVYSLGQNDYSQENTVLFEYLSSNGFIVIAVPQIGREPRNPLLMIDEELSFETQLRDLQFAYAQIHLLPYADGNKVAAMGMSMGGVYSLLSAMRNSDIKLLIGLDPTFVSANYERFAYKYWNAKYYDERNIKIPVVVLHRADTSDRNKYELVEKLKFSEREIIKYPKLIHTDFTSYPMYTSDIPAKYIDKYASDHRDQQTAVAGYEEICETVLKTLEKYLNGRPDIAITNRKDVLLMDKIKAPNEEEFCNIISKDGLKKALQLFDEVSAKYPQDTIVRLKKINRISFEYYINKNYKMAIATYTLCTKAYPNSANAFENLGEMYFFDGDKKNAQLNLRRALELDPNNKDAQQMLERNE